MLGYVVADKPELKLREFEIYNGYYCGICKSIGRRYGQLPRMILSFDAAFFALMTACLWPDEDVPTSEHCLVHPIKKKTIVSGRIIDFAADIMLILAWYKLKDDINDEGKAYAKVVCSLKKGTFEKLQRRYPQLCRSVDENLRILSNLENEKCSSLDRAAEAFSVIMEDIFMAAPLPTNMSEAEKQAFVRFGYHLGKWIYIIDAVDDIEENIRDVVYNPLLFRYDYDEGETPADFRKRIRPEIERNLYIYLGEMAKCLDLLPVRKYNGIIENIIYMGLNRKTEQVLSGIKPDKK